MFTLIRTGKVTANNFATTRMRLGISEMAVNPDTHTILVGTITGHRFYRRTKGGTLRRLGAKQRPDIIRLADDDTVVRLFWQDAPQDIIQFVAG